jgi:hypothetical protein
MTDDDDPNKPTSPEDEDLTEEHEDQYEVSLAPWDHERHEDRVRAILAGATVGVLITLSLTSYGAMLFGNHSLDDVSKLHALIVGPWFGITGTVLGFYFASRSPKP